MTNTKFYKSRALFYCYVIFSCSSFTHIGYNCHEKCHSHWDSVLEHATFTPAEIFCQELRCRRRVGVLHNVLGLNNTLFITIYTINRPGPDSKLKVYMSHPVKE